MLVVEVILLLKGLSQYEHKYTIRIMKSLFCWCTGINCKTDSAVFIALDTKGGSTSICSVESGS